MDIKTCKFVEASEVFKDMDRAWEAFANSDPQCTWGGNNRSMCIGDVISDALEDIDLDEGAQEKQVRIVIERLKELGPDVYIDLEN